ncbi:hypothetical protein [Wenzhouxiangella sp. XN24]|uniref:hypothetical protein n=1 Tax=Wenzhouxiangella sp. XN24 TaxID=2713569 RepID=UPI0013EB3DAC|nr:hypothetical protein [Wenzhouxiangella sp. XN24]NGX16310.1 hypothetical protein [Wenzhouxiangella sp. XN24]
MFQVTPWAIFGLASVTLCWALAFVLMRVGMPGSVARKLALLLTVEGFALLTTGIWFDFLAPEFAARVAGSVFDTFSFHAHTFFDCVMLALYPPFLAASLQTKLTRPFSTRGAQVGLGVFAAGLFVAVVSTPYQLGMTLLYAMMASLFLYALVASVHAWAVSKPGVARTRAGVFALAFGFRDICWFSVYAVATGIVWGGIILAEEGAGYAFYLDLFYRLGTLLYVPIIAYGILRTHLFDLDLRLRWTLKQSTLAGLVVAILYIVSEGADRFFSTELGDWGGLLAAAVVVFFLAPLQRFAERVAGAAMPNTRNTPEYTIFRKLQVYESALSDALREGGISAKERVLLGHLRDSLGISEADAAAIESDLVSRAGEVGGGRPSPPA